MIMLQWVREGAAPAGGSRGRCCLGQAGTTTCCSRGHFLAERTNRRDERKSLFSGFSLFKTQSGRGRGAGNTQGQV
ncbi:hypothetical protein XENTR_v10002413 [Xenopus tropicalis]|nr:hypothetical protein XENTR_v10002413 [Xenopus tropicalis]